MEAAESELYPVEVVRIINKAASEWEPTLVGPLQGATKTRENHVQWQYLRVVASLLANQPKYDMGPRATTFEQAMLQTRRERTMVRRSPNVLNALAITATVVLDINVDYDTVRKAMENWKD